ncbi:MAG TPA: hypothetical protein VFT66_15560 [Roseiflexaceae bacterium]|nr:hypothetical protein [Roseiflexaceae bacterium]
MTNETHGGRRAGSGHIRDDVTSIVFDKAPDLATRQMLNVLVARARGVRNNPRISHKQIVAELVRAAYEELEQDGAEEWDGNEIL